MMHHIAWPRPRRLTTVPRARFLAGMFVVTVAVFATLSMIVDYLSRIP